ncbi:MAG: RluA family pseudouridine synthase [Firmicutes bacterium]|nr:RluA family pseudouridine synthase [Bacillota bacterium]MBQ6014667.1 RluA family pseudouridine synthase [Bacillota bacterium]MBQ6261221.1 RluA family pseudouridine synthase [Bacillota bacterium]MBR0113789.1 RluA family pseudouridine synthase [Bacillota bacterium]MBR0441294.1 RluA family pseudouridine synthase [Bacillota bacterium]
MDGSNRFGFVIDEEHAGLRADSVLSVLMEDVSRSYIQKLIEGGSVTVDGKPMVSKKEKLRAGAEVVLDLPEPAPCEAVPEDIPLDIVYEDDDLIVVNKPKGMVVHPAAGNLSGTLVNALLFHCSCLSSINGVQRPGIVHRIDKDTSGLLVCAKSDAAHRGLSEQLAEHSVTRRYRAVVFGRLKDDSGRIDAPIGRDPKNRLRMAVVPGGKNAVTNYRVLTYMNGFTEIEARLETGRTHQIRVHMTSIGHPLLGDTVYGPAKQPYKLNGQMLHAGILGFVHPVTGQYMEFEAEPPEEYLTTLKKLMNR